MSRGDRGAITVFVAACLGLLLLVGSALAVVTAMVVAHRRAQSAADLAALAGAGALGRAVDPCASAASVAEANDATLTLCEVAGREVTVEVGVPGPRWLGQSADLVARARAGPA